MFIPPTAQEIDRAGHSLVSDGPQPVVQAVKDSLMGRSVELFADAIEANLTTREAIETYLLCALVMGLNTGIRVGEHRAAKTSS